MDLFSLISIAIIGIIGFLSVCEIKGRGIRARLESRRTPKPLADDDWNDQNRPEKLNYNYIDWLERDLKVAAYDPDRIAIEIETQAEEAAAILGLGMDEEDWREALTKYHDMSADEILRGIDYGLRGLIVQQSQSRGESNGWAFDYRIYVIGEVARREVRDRQLDRRPIRKLGEAKFFAPDEAKPVDDLWADENLRNGVYGPRTAERIREYERGGLLRRIVDNNGNWSEIRSFGS